MVVLTPCWCAVSHQTAGSSGGENNQYEPCVKTAGATASPRLLSSHLSASINPSPDDHNKCVTRPTSPCGTGVTTPYHGVTTPSPHSRQFTLVYLIACTHAQSWPLHIWTHMPTPISIPSREHSRTHTWA